MLRIVLQQASMVPKLHLVFIYCDAICRNMHIHGPHGALRGSYRVKTIVGIQKAHCTGMTHHSMGMTLLLHHDPT